MKKIQNILIDTDMGFDDIMAILLILNSDVNIVGFTTVSGVSDANIGANNLSSILSYVKKNLPIIVGSQKALFETINFFPKQDTSRANSLALLNSFSFSENRISQNINVADYLFESVKEYRKNITLFCIGPLTNIAKSISKYKKSLTKNINNIVLMGGGIKKGNVPSKLITEYNIRLDPEAAKIVFSSRIPIVMVGLDACLSVPAISKSQNKNMYCKLIKTIPTTPSGKMMKKLILRNKNDYDFFYDPTAALVLLNRASIKKSFINGIEVLIDGENRGVTKLNGELENVEIVMAVNPEYVYQGLFNLINQ